MKIELNKGGKRLLPFVMMLRKLFPETSSQLLALTKEAKNGITLELKPLEYAQTDSQRGYYHLWKNNFASFCGNTPDEMHEHILCEAYGSEYYRTRLGLMLRPLQRSAGANRAEYSVLIETLIRVAAEMEFVVPPPV
jgi:hypothetical protein